MLSLRKKSDPRARGGRRRWLCSSLCLGIKRSDLCPGASGFSHSLRATVTLNTEEVRGLVSERKAAPPCSRPWGLIPQPGPRVCVDPSRLSPGLHKAVPLRSGARGREWGAGRSRGPQLWLQIALRPTARSLLQRADSEQMGSDALSEGAGRCEARDGAEPRVCLDETGCDQFPGPVPLGGQLGAGAAFTLNEDWKMTVPSHWVG